MKLGLDLSGGVHFLLEVDMEKAIAARIKVYDSEVKTILRKERIRYRSLPSIENGVQLGFDDEATLNKARSLIRKDFTDFEMVAAELNGKPVLRLTLLPAKITEIREYSINKTPVVIARKRRETGCSFHSRFSTSRTSTTSNRLVII